MFYAHINIIVVYFDTRVKIIVVYFYACVNIIEFYTCIKIIVVYLNAFTARDFGAARNIFKLFVGGFALFFNKFFVFSIAVYFILPG